MNEEPLRVVVLTGRKKAGKDTMALELIKQGYTRLSFSDQLKRICSNLFPFLEVDYPQEIKDTKFIEGDGVMLSPRDIWLKMNVITEIDKNILVDSLRDELESLMCKGVRKFVVTDLRKNEEYDWVKAFDYPIIKIVDGASRDGIVEDELENFIDTIRANVEFVNYKDPESKVRFTTVVEEVLNETE